jgi:hypothetical protein
MWKDAGEIHLSVLAENRYGGHREEAVCAVTALLICSARLHVAFLHPRT